MCASSGPHICLFCLLLYGCQAHAEVGVNTSDKYDVSTVNVDVNDDTEQLYLKEKDFFMTKLMTKYGNGIEMSFEGFEHLLHNLGLGGIFKFDHEVSYHRSDNSSKFLQLHRDHHHDSDINHAHSEEHNHAHTDEHNHAHTDEHNHAHTDEQNQAHTDEHNHDHNDGHNHDHNNDCNHNHTVEYEHDSKDQHNHDHTDEHINAHEHSQDHDQTDKHNHDHDHIDEHNHDHTGEHSHDNTHKDDHNHDHEHTSNDHNHDHDHTDEHNHDHDYIDEHNKIITDDHHAHNHDHDVHKREMDSSQCLSASLLLHMISSDKPKSITKEMFEELCPSLVYQIDQDSCHSSHRSHNGFHGNSDGCHNESDQSDQDNDSNDHPAHAKSASDDISKVSPKVWGFSTLAVVIISLVGLVGVAVIPIMQKVFYNHLLQFLVALAVGTLSGDALLHLFPHAIAGGHEGHGHNSDGGHSHDTGPVYKGLCGLLGIYFFFFTERILTIFTDYKRKKKGLNDEEMMKIGEKLANDECDGMMMNIHPNKAVMAYADETHTEHCTVSFENSTSVSHEHVRRKTVNEETCVDGDEHSSMINKSDSSTPRHHGHGHSHGVDEVPNSVTSVAWMLIMGDGIHNFCDGLAIGAAFVASITGGVSTSVAIFCHELPHEIGDFAVLLRAGMSPKQAILYSSLSSVLCFVGMLVGIAVGNLEGATFWVYSIVGGMFLYISLVDMLPELSSVGTKKGEHPLCHLLLQGMGIFSGAGIMLAIALFEGDLMKILD